MTDVPLSDRCNPLYDFNDAKNNSNVNNVDIMNTSEQIGSGNHNVNVTNATICQPQEASQSEDITDEGKMCVASLPSSPKIRELPPPLLPHVDSPERLILCLDISSEMNKATFKAKAGELYSALHMMKKSVAMFVKTKAILDNRNQFALVTLTDTAEWLCDFTDNTKEILYLLDSLQCPATPESSPPTPSFSVHSLYETIYQNTELPIVEGDATVLPPPFIVRVVLVYGRSHGLVDITQTQFLQSLEILNASPYFYFDCIYLHDPLTGGNQCEEIYDTLMGVADIKGLSYIFEISRNPTKVYDSMAKLLAHPLQRVLQNEAHYKIKHTWADD